MTEVPDDSANEMLVGFTLLKDASKEDLILEILEHQRHILEDMEMIPLRCNVIELRVTDYKKRLAEEAGLTVNILGYQTKDEGDDDSNA